MTTTIIISLIAALAAVIAICVYRCRVASLESQNGQLQAKLERNRKAWNCLRSGHMLRKHYATHGEASAVWLVVPTVPTTS